MDLKAILPLLSMDRVIVFGLRVAPSIQPTLCNWWDPLFMIWDMLCKTILSYWPLLPTYLHTLWYRGGPEIHGLASVPYYAYHLREFWVLFELLGWRIVVCLRKWIKYFFSFFFWVDVLFICFTLVPLSPPFPRLMGRLVWSGAACSGSTTLHST